MTVSELRKYLKGVPGSMPVYIADHDHAEFEVNSIAGYAEVMDKRDADAERERATNYQFDNLPNKYLVIRP